LYPTYLNIIIQGKVHPLETSWWGPSVDYSELHRGCYVTVAADQIQVTVTNGDEDADVDVDLLLVSADPADMAGCTISWGDAQAGLDFVEEVLEGKLHSQLSGTLSMAADDVVVLDLEATLHCFEKSLHVDAFELAAGAAALPPVWDENSANNIEKNWPDVTAWEYADLKIVTQYVDSPPTDISVGVPVMIDLVKVIHNNGPYGPVDAQVDKLASADPGCDVAPTSDSVVVNDIPVSTDVVLNEAFEIQCSEPSTHSFYFDNDVTVLTEHVIDPDPANSTASVQLDVNALAVADVEVIDQYFEAPPTEIDVSEEVVLTLVKVLENTGYSPVEVEVSKTASASAGASILPAL